MISLRPTTLLALTVALLPLVACAEDSAISIQLPEDVAATTAINLLVETQWSNADVEPSPRCDDRTFARRVYLDLVGRIPTRSELDAFLAETESNKRTTLVDRLLETAEYGRHFADVFDVVLMGRASQRRMEQRQQHGWRTYLEESFNANRPWNMMARDMTLARNSDGVDVRAGWFLYERDNDHQAIAETVSPVFFGIRIECAQCHDHPLADEIAQGHYWGLVSFFQRGKNDKTKAGPRVVESASGAFNKFTNLEGDSFNAELTFYASSVIPEPRPQEGESEKPADDSALYVTSVENEPRVPKFSRREKFVDHVLLKHPMLAKAYVNRIWALLVGRGFVHPVDRMDSTSDISHPQLLEWLANDLANSDFDTKRLVRSIALSRPYQLAARTNAQTQPDTFSYGIEKPLTAESLLRSIYVAIDPDRSEPDSDLLAEFRDKFADVFAEEPSSNPTQTLYLTNNPSFNQTLRDSQLVKELVQAGDAEEQVVLAFESILGRVPDHDELQMATNFLTSQSDNRASEADVQSKVVSLVWAIVTSAEFRFNH